MFTEFNWHFGLRRMPADNVCCSNAALMVPITNITLPTITFCSAAVLLAQLCGIVATF